MENNVLMQGNEACVAGAIKAGMKFYAGYPISPASEIAELCSVRLPENGGKFIQMEDEIAGAAAIVGAALTGVKAMTATSGPGFSLKQEVLGYASMAEVPCVFVDVMRGGPSTGLPTSVSQGDVMQSRWGTHGDHPIIVVAPVTVKDIYTMTIKAFNLAEKYRTPVIVLLDEANAHMRENINLDDVKIDIINRKRADKLDGFKPYEFSEDLVPTTIDIGAGAKFHTTGLVHDEYGQPSNSNEMAEKLIDRLMDKTNKIQEEDFMYDVVNVNENSDLSDLIVAYGSTARVSKEVVNNIKTDAGLFIPYTIWPFPERQLSELIDNKNVKRIFVPELNAGQLVLEIERIVKGRCEVIAINKNCGEIFTPGEIANVMEVNA